VVARTDAPPHPHPLSSSQVEYENLPAIISMADAIAAQSFQYQNEKGCGDVDQAFASGECEVGLRCLWPASARSAWGSSAAGGYMC
jgi:hypothetical protein